MTQVNQQSDWLTPGEAARVARIGIRTIQRAMRSTDPARRLRAAKVNGRDRRIHKDWLRAWLNQSAGLEAA